MLLPVIGQDWSPEVRDEPKLLWGVLCDKFGIGKILPEPTLGHLRCSTENSQTIFLSWKIVRDCGYYHDTCSLLRVKSGFWVGWPKGKLKELHNLICLNCS